MILTCLSSLIQQIPILHCMQGSALGARGMHTNTLDIDIDLYTSLPAVTYIACFF